MTSEKARVLPQQKLFVGVTIVHMVHEIGLQDRLSTFAII